ncbi:MAG: S46 family peptidase, partial [Bryobacteraceae bacterium]
MLTLALCGTFGAATVGLADEGMWTFDNPPTKLIQEKYNFTLTKDWLDHVRLSCVRLNDGGSGSFVSPHGLLLTNHHVARGQLQKNSTPEHDYINNGFYAATPEQEMKSPDLEINVLISTEDVTARVQDAVKNAKNPDQEFAARKKAIAAIEEESLQKTGLRSDVITLYQGGEYWLYRYKKYTDVRLVFAPEQQAAFFGGDPDNFTYPRYDLDLALFRVYENGKPIDSPNYLKWNPKGADDGDLVFVTGNPGSTERLDTVAQLEMERDFLEPNILKVLRNRIQVLKKFSDTTSEHALQAGTQIFGLENSVKAIDGEHKGLLNVQIMDTKRKDEAAFKEKVMSNPELKAKYGSAWDQIAAAEKNSATRVKESYYHSTDSQIAGFAQTIVQYVAEIKKPDGERLNGYHEAQLESLRFRMNSPAPVYTDMEIARITGAL